jgi:uncharacterized protein
MITNQLILAILSKNRLRAKHSIHYLDHWARVWEIGSRLAPLTGARLDVVELFAVFHDSGRWNEGSDDGHGERGAKIAASMHGEFFQLDAAGLEQLLLACREHTFGKIEADVTVQTCWDSDRLDLGRAGIKPAAKRLCTPAARDPEILAWAHERSVRRQVPCGILAGWGIDVTEYDGCP